MACACRIRNRQLRVLRLCRLHMPS
jgi:hypothetical protein